MRAKHTWTRPRIASSRHDNAATSFRNRREITSGSPLCAFIPLNPPSSKAVALILFCPAHSYSSKPRPLSPSMSPESSSPNAPSRWHKKIYLDINVSKKGTYNCTEVFNVPAFVGKLALLICAIPCVHATLIKQETKDTEIKPFYWPLLKHPT